MIHPLGALNLRQNAKFMCLKRKGRGRDIIFKAGHMDATGFSAVSCRIEFESK